MHDGELVVQNGVQPLLKWMGQVSGCEDVSERLVISVNNKIITTPYVGMEAAKGVYVRI